MCRVRHKTLLTHLLSMWWWSCRLIVLVVACIQDCLTFPSSNGRVSQSAEKLICSLLTESENRLDYNGIRGHPFFVGVDFDNIRQSKMHCYLSLCHAVINLISFLCDFFDNSSYLLLSGCWHWYMWYKYIKYVVSNIWHMPHFNDHLPSSAMVSLWLFLALIMYLIDCYSCCSFWPS